MAARSAGDFPRAAKKRGRIPCAPVWRSGPQPDDGGWSGGSNCRGGRAAGLHRDTIKRFAVGEPEKRGLTVWPGRCKIAVRPRIVARSFVKKARSEFARAPIWRTTGRKIPHWAYVFVRAGLRSPARSSVARARRAPTGCSPKKGLPAAMILSGNPGDQGLESQDSERMPGRSRTGPTHRCGRGLSDAAFRRHDFRPTGLQILGQERSWVGWRPNQRQRETGLAARQIPCLADFRPGQRSGGSARG